MGAVTWAFTRSSSVMALSDAASDGSVRSKGTMYFVMQPHGIHATGRWVGLSYDDNIVTGRSSMARTEADARKLVDELKEQDASGSR